MSRIPFIKKNSKPVRFLRAAERLAGRFCQRHPSRLLAAIGFSLLGGAGMLLDYALMTAFLNIPLSFWKMTTGWMMGWISFIIPLPGGLGALEASQVFTLGMFGFSAAAALSLTLVMRGRDIADRRAGAAAGRAGWNRRSQYILPQTVRRSKREYFGRHFPFPRQVGSEDEPSIFSPLVPGMVAKE